MKPENTAKKPNITGQPGNQDSALRILIVDDEQSIVDFLQLGLTYEGFKVAIAMDGKIALDQVRAFQPHLVLLDIMLPEMDGFTVCHWLHTASDCAVIMLTARDEVNDRIRGLDGGADDYLTKPFDFRELVARIRAVLRRRNLPLQNVLYVGNLTLNRDTREVTKDDKPVDLTPKEFELLELFMAHPRQVFSRETILNRLWGYDYTGDTSIIEVHISYLRGKVDTGPARLIQTVRGVGYVLKT